MSNLSKALRDKLIPWVERNAGQRCIIACKEMKQSSMPVGVQLTRVKIPGKRVVIKNQRFYNNSRQLTAVWPQAALNEVQRFKLVCVLSGYTDYQLGETIVNCGPGHFICIPPGFPHSDGTRNCVAQSETKHCELLYINLYPNSIQVWIDCFKQDAEDGTENIIPQGNALFLNGRLACLFQLMMEEIVEHPYHEDGDGKPSVADGLMQSFFSALQRDVVAEQYLSVNHTDSDYGRQHHHFDNADFTSELQNYIQAHLHEVLTVENAARHMYLSRSQFTRKMRQEIGQSFVEYLTAYRIQEAKRLLIESKWTASAIAEIVGFKTTKYFYRIFREHTGVPPITFRNLQASKK